MSNYRLVIQYDGGRYRGWQRQEEEQDTIQRRIEKVIRRQYGMDIRIQGAGRTDAGVHARGQVANFHMAGEVPVEEIRDKLNEYLPEDIRIMAVERAGDRFHSRLNATGKIYEYSLQKAGTWDVFGRRYSWQMNRELDVDRMREAIPFLLGKRDFRGFCARASKKKSTVRDLRRIDIREDEGKIVICFEGNGFLYHMVRILTGTLVEIGTGERAPESIQEILMTGERRLAGVTAPAAGLCLVEVQYD